MGSKLKAALAAAARGQRVFPLKENSKEPLFLGWIYAATLDPKIITLWWTDPFGAERNYNIGILCDDFIVVDVDVKYGKQGYKTFFALGFDLGTYSVTTPSGGAHYYFNKNDIKHLVGNAPLGPGIDVRSYHGLVVGPGSEIDGKEYTLDNDVPLADFPKHLIPKLKLPRIRQERREVYNEEDTQETVNFTKSWLAEDAPPAIEGKHGDDTTYRVACRVRDLGVSEELAFELMRDYYNDRCNPPWEVDELERKVSNAYAYATGLAGIAQPSASFADIQIIPSPAIEPTSDEELSKQYINGVYAFGNMVKEKDMTPRPWLMNDLLLTEAITVLIGGGGVGKSLLGLIIAAHVVLGRDFLGHRAHKPGRAIVYEAEDSLMEMSRRLTAICVLYQLPVDEVRERLSLNSSDALYGVLSGMEPIELPRAGLRIAEGKPVQPNAGALAELIRAASAPDVTLIMIGPLVDIHEAEENDNPAMGRVMAALRDVARAAQVAIIAIHHTSKPPAAIINAWVGNANAGRGATSISNSARIVLTLFGASKEDCVQIGVDPAERPRYVRLDGAKSNQAALMSEPTWLHWRSHRINTGDSVGVLVPHDAKVTTQNAALAIAEALYRELLRLGRGSLDMATAVTALQGANPLYAETEVSILRSQLRRMLVKPIQVEAGAKIRIMQAVSDKGKASQVITME